VAFLIILNDLITTMRLLCIKFFNTFITGEG
jgi:hypothetical protein